MMNSWRFSETLGVGRVQRLQAAPAYEDLVVALEQEVKNVIQRAHGEFCFHLQSADGAPSKDYHRALASFTVGKELFDCFFNSERGYRGQYFISPEQGLIANRALIDALMPSILRAGAGFDSDWIQQSLCAVSAKAWLAECGLGLCGHCEGEWTPRTREPEIMNGRWEIHEDWGAQVVDATQIKVLGAFVNRQDGSLWIPNHKLNRANQIHEKGWS